MIIIIFLKVQAAAENFQTAVSHVWSSHLSPDLGESDTMPGRGSGSPTLEQSICVMTSHHMGTAALGQSVGAAVVLQNRSQKNVSSYHIPLPQYH